MQRGRLQCARASVKRTCPLLVDNNGGRPAVNVEQYLKKSFYSRAVELHCRGVAYVNSVNRILSIAVSYIN